MALSPSQLLLNKVHEAFPNGEDAEIAFVVLERFIPLGGEELQLAAIEASGGRIWKLRELVAIAKKDFRDVFFEANSPETVRELRERQRADPTWYWGRQQYFTNLAKRKANGEPRPSNGP